MMMKFYSMASLSFKEEQNMKALMFLFFLKKKKHFIKSINVNETNTVWTAKLHFPIISDTFTVDT